MAKKNQRALFVTNAFANIIGGGAGALFTLILPAMVVRSLTAVEFSIWALAIQMLIYVQLFGFGLQNAVTHFIAHGHELEDLDDQRKTIKAAVVLAAVFVGIATFAVLALLIFYPLLFSDVPSNLVADFRICIALLGLSAAWQLFALVPSGIFTGYHQNIIPVAAQLLTRILSLAVVWSVLKAGVGIKRNLNRFSFMQRYGCSFYRICPLSIQRRPSHKTKASG